MVCRPTIIGVSGSVTRPSRTTALVHAIIDAIAARRYGTDVIELADAAPRLFSAITPSKIGGAAWEILDAAEGANLLVVGTPVYRASMTGARSRISSISSTIGGSTASPVVLAATGGSLMHGLVTEHQSRPLFGFLKALTLPTTIYAVDSDFDSYQVLTAKIGDRIERVVDESAFTWPACPRAPANVPFTHPPDPDLASRPSGNADAPVNRFTIHRLRTCSVRGESGASRHDIPRCSHRRGRCHTGTKRRRTPRALPAGADRSDRHARWQLRDRAVPEQLLGPV